MPTLLSLGHGYSAAALTPLLQAKGWHIIGTTRDAAKARALEKTGVEPLIWPQDLETALDRATHVLSSIAPGPGGDPVLQRLGAALQRAKPAWAGYLSTTAVYGDQGGAWVDETTPPAPSTERGQARWAAEQGWRDLGLPLHIFRLAGIYGPGRGPFEKVRDGTARRIVKPGQVFSRIHVDDIAGAVLAAIERPSPGIYNLCDDDPAPPEDVLAEAARLLGLPPPPEMPFDQADMTPMARSFYAENKRVRNTAMKTRLGYQLRYPDYRAGLQSLLAARNN